MGKAEKIAKLQALLTRVEQRSAGSRPRLAAVPTPASDAELQETLVARADVKAFEKAAPSPQPAPVAPAAKSPEPAPVSPAAKVVPTPRPQVSPMAATKSEPLRTPPPAVKPQAEALRTPAPVPAPAAMATPAPKPVEIEAPKPAPEPAPMAAAPPAAAAYTPAITFDDGPPPALNDTAVAKPGELAAAAASSDVAHKAEPRLEPVKAPEPVAAKVETKPKPAEKPPSARPAPIAQPKTDLAKPEAKPIQPLPETKGPPIGIIAAILIVIGIIVVFLVSR
jgi:hypothetical protein